MAQGLKKKRLTLIMATSGASPNIRPPELRESAYEESRREREGYRRRFQDEDTPAEFRYKFLDQKLAVRMLLRTRRRRILVLECAAYTILVGFYCIYLFAFMSLPDSYLYKRLFAQTLATKPFNFERVFYRYSPGGGETPSEQCTLPLKSASDVFTSSTAQNNSIPCLQGIQSLTFAEIQDVDHTYSWLQFVLLRSPLFVGGEDRSQVFVTMTASLEGQSEDDSRTTLIMPDNSFIPVGAVRLRQLRVKRAPCSNDTVFEGQTCNLPFSEANLNTSDIVGTSSGRLYSFQSADDLAKASFSASNIASEVNLDSGKLNAPDTYQGILENYPGSGYVIDIEGGNGTIATETFEQLQMDRWIDESTVALFVSFTAYAVNLDTYIHQTFLVELSSYGLTATSMETRPFKLLISQDGAWALEILLMTLSSVLLVLIFYYHFWPALQTSRSITSLLLGWDMYDVFNLSMVIASVAVRMTLRTSSTAQLATKEATLVSLMTENRRVYPAVYESYSRVLVKAQMLAGWSLVICFLKYFKYVDMNKRFSIALASLVESRTRLAGWLVFTVIVILGLTFFCMFAYGFYSLRFAEFSESLTSLLLFMVQIFGEGFDHLSGSDAATSSSWSSLSFVALRYGTTGLPMSLSAFEVVDKSYSIPLAQSLFFSILLVVVVIILVANMFQAILILGYQTVAHQVQEDENLRKEQREVLLRSQRMLNQSWLRRQVKELGRMLRFREHARIINQLQSAPEARARNLLSYAEVRRLVGEIVTTDSQRASEIAYELMSLYQTTLSRIDDAVILFQDRAIALREGRLHEKLDPSELPVIDPSQGFDAAQAELWRRDLQSGELLQSMLLVHSLQLEASSKHFKKDLDQILQGERDHRELCINLETAMHELQSKEIAKKGDIRTSQDPYEARPGSIVEVRIDGLFDAHFVSQGGHHTYLGCYPTRSAAQGAIEDMAVRATMEDAQTLRLRNVSRESGATSPPGSISYHDGE